MQFFCTRYKIKCLKWYAVTDGADMDRLSKVCMVVATLSLALLAADTLLWTLIDISNDENDIYEIHLQMHEEMDS